MASDTDSTSNDEAGLALSWSRRWTLGHRILAVNILTIGLFVVSVLYLDAYRDRVIRERERQTRLEASLVASAIATMVPSARQKWLGAAGKVSRTRYRIYAPDGRLAADSWTETGPTYQLRDPASQRWQKDVAQALDRGFNAIVGERNPPDFIAPRQDRATAWGEIAGARQERGPVSMIRLAPDLTPVISAAAFLPELNGVLDR